MPDRRGGPARYAAGNPAGGERRREMIMLGQSNSQRLGGSHQNGLKDGPAYGAQTYLAGAPVDPRRWYGSWA
jgi:hypothetical protein